MTATTAPAKPVRNKTRGGRALVPLVGGVLAAGLALGITGAALVATDSRDVTLGTSAFGIEHLSTTPMNFDLLPSAERTKPAASVPVKNAGTTGMEVGFYIEGLEGLPEDHPARTDAMVYIKQTLPEGATPPEGRALDYSKPLGEFLDSVVISDFELKGGETADISFKIITPDTAGGAAWEAVQGTPLAASAKLITIGSQVKAGDSSTSDLTSGAEFVTQGDGGAYVRDITWLDSLD